MSWSCSATPSAQAALVTEVQNAYDPRKLMAHGHTPDAEHIALPALLASAGLDSERQIFYPDFIHAALGPLARAALELLMNANTKTHPFYSDFARKYYDAGEARGEANGEASGEAKGEARLLLKLLRLRGFALTPEQQARIERCTDTAQLELWAERLLAATTVADVFDPA